VPIDAYRGSGRPEATWVNERLLENGAREIGIDVMEMRKRNVIQRSQFPYKTPVGRTYDSGNPPCSLRSLLRWQSTKSYEPSRRGCGNKAC